MEKKVEILAYHGWGFDTSFWKPMSEVLPSGIDLKPANRGYIGKPFHPRFDADTKYRIVFTHSFGLHWCNSAVLSKADLLVIFNGFGDFHPDEEKLRKISIKGLERMISGFETSPEKILDAFYRNCFNTDEEIPDISTDLNSETLLEDLKQLRGTKFPLIDLDFGSTMVALDSGQDKVLLTPRGEQITASHYHKKYVHVFEDEVHALPFSNPQDCWSYLCSIIPIFQRYENNR